MRHEPPLLSQDLLRKFVAGELDDVANEQILAQLAEDETSLEFVDALWQEQPWQTAVNRLPDLDPAQAKKMRRRLIHQIRRADLVVNVARLGTQGFGFVAVSLLRPLLGGSKPARRNRRRSRGND